MQAGFGARCGTIADDDALEQARKEELQLYFCHRIPMMKEMYLEIRGGTGGDEAAYGRRSFCMYSRMRKGKGGVQS